MQQKRELKNKVRLLRKKGMSLKHIENATGAARSSVSVWVRDIVLTTQQIKALHQNQHSQKTIELRRSSRLLHERARRQKYYDEGVRMFADLSKKNLFMLALGLYWGEGSKSSRGTCSVTNSDPWVIQVMIRFFRELCAVPQHKIYCHIHVHAHMDVKKIEEYWQRVTQLPAKNFFKTTIQKNRVAVPKDSLPYGTCAISVYDTVLRIKIESWMHRSYETYIPKPMRLAQQKVLQF